MKTLMIATFLTLGSTLPALAAWVPVDYEDRPTEFQRFHQSVGRVNVDVLWQKHSARVRGAKPRSPLYAPHPFPANHAEIIANFKYAYFGRLFEGAFWEKLPIARSAMYGDGLMAIYRHVSAEREQGILPGLNNLASTLRANFAQSFSPDQAQYVTVSGLPSCTNETKPCVAFRSQGKIYLLDYGDLLYEVDPSTPGTSVRDYYQQLGREGLQRLGQIEFDAPMVSLGFEYAKARLIAGRKPE